MFRFKDMRRAAAVALLAATTALAACSRAAPDACADDDPAIARVPVQVRVERLERDFFQLQTPTQAIAFLNAHPAFARQYLLRRQYPSDTVLARQLLQLTTNEGLRKLYADTQKEFGELGAEQQQLMGAFQHVKYYFPAFQPPRVVTFVSGLSQDLFVNDSLMVLGLDFFVGPKATYRPDTYRYILRRYQRPYLVPAAMLQVANKYLQQDFADKTMLNQMVQLGKSYYFLDRVLPCTADSLKIGFTSKELTGVQFNEGKIWGHILERNLLYSTEQARIQKYIGERPNVPEVGKEAPGRIGAWVGWQIVKAYMAENPGVTLPQLMAETDAQKILNQSHYKPKK